MSNQTPGQGALPPPSWLGYVPRELGFGTSGLRGLVRDMTDLEVYINTRGFLGLLRAEGEIQGGAAVAIAEDLRATDPTSGLESSPRIARAVMQAVRDEDCEPRHFGRIPTPALAFYAMLRDEPSGKEPMPAIMVTGSHIPADRNGVKFYRKGREVLKQDEAAILAAVRLRREAEYSKSAVASSFDAAGMLKAQAEPLRFDFDPVAERAYEQRYLAPFAGARPLGGARVVVYQHSAVGRDLLVRVLEALGAKVWAVERSAGFVPVDTEDVSERDLAKLRALAAQFAPDAIVSTDGDSDRPLLADEHGCFRRGDVLGIVVAELLGARFAAVPISTSDALDLYLAARACRESAPSMTVHKTRIGSPFVIEAMQQAAGRGLEGVVGWEANGGFLSATALRWGAGTLGALPTRDALLPLLAVLCAATERRVRVSSLFDALPARATQAGLIDGFPTAASQAILARFRPADRAIVELAFADGRTLVRRTTDPAVADATVASDELAAEAAQARSLLARYFTSELGFGELERISLLDGVRCFFANGDIAHLRPSGNAPQLRLYAVAGSQSRADAIVAHGVREPDGILRRMLAELATCPA